MFLLNCGGAARAPACCAASRPMPAIESSEEALRNTRSKNPLSRRRCQADLSHSQGQSPIPRNQGKKGESCGRPVEPDASVALEYVPLPLMGSHNQRMLLHTRLNPDDHKQAHALQYAHSRAQHTTTHTRTGTCARTQRQPHMHTLTDISCSPSYGHPPGNTRLRRRGCLRQPRSISRAAWRFQFGTASQRLVLVEQQLGSRCRARRLEGACTVEPWTKGISQRVRVMVPERKRDLLVDCSTQNGCVVVWKSLLEAASDSIVHSSTKSKCPYEY